MIITTKNSHPQKTQDQEIFTASQFLLERTGRRCSNTEKPSRNGERETITTKGKTKTSSRNPWRAASFEVSCLQWQRGAVTALPALGPSWLQLCHLPSSAVTALPQLPSSLLTKSKPLPRSELLQIQNEETDPLSK